MGKGYVWGGSFLDGFVVKSNEKTDIETVKKDFFPDWPMGLVLTNKSSDNRTFEFIFGPPLVTSDQAFMEKALALIDPHWRHWFAGNLVRYMPVDRFLNETRERKARHNVKEQHEKELAANSPTGHSYQVLLELKDGAYESDEHFVTVYSGTVVVSLKVDTDEKAIRWLLERGVSLLHARKYNEQSVRICFSAAVSSAVGAFGELSSLFLGKRPSVLSSREARDNQRLLDNINKRPVKGLKALPSL